MDEIELPELVGRTIASAKVIKASVSEQELSLEFSDGTSLSFSCSSSIKTETTLYRGGVGEPEFLRQLTSE